MGDGVMSSNLFWEPLSPPHRHYLATTLKFILRRKYGEPLDCTLSADDMPYLQGIRDAGNAEAREDVQYLIKAINRFEKIRVKEEYQ
jgi:hypothetical protein